MQPGRVYVQELADVVAMDWMQMPFCSKGRSLSMPMKTSCRVTELITNYVVFQKYT